MGETQVNLGAPEGFESLNQVTIGGVVSFAITAILVLAGVIFFFMLIIGGIRWILSGGDKAKTEGARNQITAALIGLVIVFSAWAITALVGGIFNVDLLNLNFGGIEGTAG